ncbi:imidazolonepropionase [Roseiterribacter gracilis]|uniref:Imidazolonepropionase n=1 Tax=Roseiterribacter gracilis TaxID=2812848 RepID=A0A8S8X9R5_9PROT|nr:imidazolonepropionase [Rhodospirillales bacterium TMPK1]
MTAIDLLLTDCNVATMDGPGVGEITDAAIAIAQGRIVWVGPRRDAPQVATTERLDGQWVTPGLIDCHTHLVFGGTRVGEWEARLDGESYESIAKRGGGIRSTVAATRAASDDELRSSAQTRLDALIAGGVTTVEIKSGYGLDHTTELRMLRVAGELQGARVVRSFLGLHALPPDVARETYVRDMVEIVLPAAHAEGLVDQVDAFLETIAFNTDEVTALFRKAKALGLPVKLHADQLSDGKGAALAASFGALSADHVEHTGADGVAAMARSGTVAVLLPGAFHTLRETKLPPIDEFRRAKVAMAVATDCNPGSSPMLSLPLAMNFACVRFGLTPSEALAGVTRNAAAALGMAHEIGTIAAGKRADLVAWEIDRPAELAYWLGLTRATRRWIGGTAT